MQGVRGTGEAPAGRAAPAPGRPRAHRGATLAACALLGIAVVLALVPFHGTATVDGARRGVSCGAPFTERARSDPARQLDQYFRAQAALNGEHGPPSRNPVLTHVAAEKGVHFAACHDRAASRSTLAALLGLPALAGLGVLFVTRPVGREDRRERPRRLGHQPALDGLRALSIIVVLIFHCGVHGRLANAGYLGVGAFFVLSGFLITTLVLDEHRRFERVNLRHFYARRALRLLPLALLLVLVGVIVRFAMPADSVRPDFAALVGTAFYSSNWVAIFKPSALGLLGHTWSLAIEEQFYLVWPPLLVFLFARHVRRGQLLALTGAACLVSAAARALYWRHVLATQPLPRSGTAAATAAFVTLEHRWNRWYLNSFTRADALLVGCFAAILLSTVVVISTRGRRALLLLGPAAVVVVAAVYWRTGRPGDTLPTFLAEWGLLLFSIGVAAVVAVVVLVPTGAISRALSLRPLTWVGKRSYGMYIIHWPVLGLLNRHLHLGQWNAAVVIGVTFALSALSFRYLEAPILRLKSRRFGHADARPTLDQPVSAPHVEPSLVRS